MRELEKSDIPKNFVDGSVIGRIKLAYIVFAKKLFQV